MDAARPRKNPWLSIPAADYEGHMGHPDVRQTELLNGVFREVLDRVRPESIVVLGCSTGNGFEHIDPQVTRRVTGIDINPEYLRVLESRFGPRIAGLKLVCADVAECDLPAASIDLVHCALFLEYVEPRVVVEKASSWLGPRGCFSVVLQMACESQRKVTNTGFESVKRLETVMQLVSPDELAQVSEKAGLRRTSSRVVTLEGGKRFHVARYEKGRTCGPGEPG